MAIGFLRTFPEKWKEGDVEDEEEEGEVGDEGEGDEGDEVNGGEE